MKTLKRTLSFLTLLLFCTSILTAQVDRPDEERPGDGNQTGTEGCDDWWVGDCGPASSIHRSGSVHIGGTGNATPNNIKLQVTGNALVSKGNLFGLNVDDNGTDKGFVIKASDGTIEGSYFHLRSVNESGDIAAVTRGATPEFKVSYNIGEDYNTNFRIKHTGEMIGRRSLQLNTLDATIPLRVKISQWGEELFNVGNDGKVFGQTFRIGPSYWNPEWDFFRIQENGKVVVGDAAEASNGYLLSVAQGIQTQKVRVCANANSWCDYVFADDYELNPIEKVEAHIKKYKHLPNVPSAQEVEENGINVAEMDATLLRQIEELWLHVIDLKKENDSLKEELENLKR